MDQKAFIFDMDGVILDSETWWDKYKYKIISKQVAAKMSSSRGHSVISLYEEAKQNGLNLSWDEYFTRLNRLAQKIYQQIPLTKNINALIAALAQRHYRLALVSSSTPAWIDCVIKRLAQPISPTISLYNHPCLKPKPHPDGYLEAMKILEVKPQNTIILEDSLIGIQSGKATGAYVVCLTEHHPKNYHPSGADLYVNSLKELATKLDSIKL